MKKLLLASLAVITLIGSASAVDYPNVFPSNAPMNGALYAEVQTSQLGRALIIIPIAFQEGSISLKRGSSELFNITNGTISGQIYSGNNYQNSNVWRMTRMSTSEYQNTSNSNYNVLTITQIFNTNVILADNNGTTPIATVDPEMIYTLTIILILGGIFLCLLWKR